MKRTAKVPFAWVLKGDDEDKLWAEQYIREKGRAYVWNGIFNDLEKLMVFTDQWRDPLSIREVEASMRNAWRQRQARKKNSPGKKSYNYTFSNTTKRQLDALADDLHLGLTDTLEELINGGAHQQEQYAAEKKQIAEKHKKQLGRMEDELTEAYQAMGEILDELKNHLTRWSVSAAESQQSLLVTNYAVTAEQRAQAAQDIYQREMRRIATQLVTARMMRRLPPEWRDALRSESSRANGDQTVTKTRKII